MSDILKSTESSHRIAINMVPWVIEHSEQFPEDIRNLLIGSALDILPLGDKIGSTMLHYYDQIVRSAYSIK